VSKGLPVHVTSVIPARTSVPLDAWAAVNVASVWRHPSSPRKVDAPGLTARPRIAQWYQSLSTTLKYGLHDRLDSQVLLGTYVRIIGHQGHWSKVEIPQQVGGYFPGGITGWIPTVQLTQHRPPTTYAVATVKTRLAPASRVGSGGRGVTVPLSYGTTLPLLSKTTRWARVAWPTGERRQLPRGSVIVHRPAAAAVAPGRQTVINEARRFLGLPFIWAGKSGFGYDCAGMVSAVYHQMGVDLPADAADQAGEGRSVARSALRPGDLVFFSSDGTQAGIHHAAIYAGHGRIIESPHTGAKVMFEALPSSSSSYGYWGARRIL
jgi:cell wall-associated NlpC family hydrolase